MHRINIDITDFYNEILIFLIWYTAWGILDSMFSITASNPYIALFITILLIASFILIYRSI